MTAPIVDEIRRELPLGIHAVGEARKFVETTIATWGAGTEDIAAAELLTSELVTNAVLYGHGAHTLTLRRDGPLLRILVSDSAPGLPTRRAAEDDAEVGHGMQLIEGYARAWGVDVHDGGKTVWCEVTISGR
jgi:anti-sigma regulatory factor (Ser/Thr protein kinase)